MGSIYIINDAGKLGKQDEALVFTSFGGDKRFIFLHEADRLIMLGNVEISSSALKLIMRHKVDTVFLNKNGLFNAKLEFEQGKNVFIRRNQYKLLDDEKAVLPIVASILEGKIKNQLRFMQKINRKGNTIDLNTSIKGMHSLLDRIPSVTSVEIARGIEGAASRYFFKAFKYNIEPEWAVFNGRSKNPPLDNVNAVLSLLYTYLYYRIDALIEMEGLDPCVGYLHTLEYGRRSLSFDLMEEFRVPVCDTLCCAMFNLGILKEDDFEQKENEEGSNQLNEAETTKLAKPTYLTKDGLKKVSSRFEEKLSSCILYPPSGEELSYFSIMRKQVEHFKRIIKGEEKEYHPFTIR